MTLEKQLQDVQKQVLRKRELTYQLRELYLRQKELAPKAEALEQIQASEQKDVGRLEKKGLTSLFYSIIGKRDEKLERERREAQNARIRYKEVRQELECVTDSIKQKEEEYAALKDCEEIMAGLLQEKRRFLEHEDSQALDGIRWMEQELKELDERREAMLETKKLGEKLREKISAIQTSLNQAEDAAVQQSFSGLAMEIAKSEHLSKAQEMAAALKEQLETFGRGLEQAFVDEQIRANLGVFFEFGNGIYSYWIFSNTVMEVAVIERIRTAKSNMKQVDSQIRSGLEQLAERLKHMEKDRQAVQNKLETYIINAVV